MNCPHCGTALPQGVQSCPACGTFIVATPDYNAFPPQNSGYPQGFDPTAYGQRGYAQNYQPPVYGQSGYQQGYDGAPPAQGGYNAPPAQSGYGAGYDPAGYGYSQQQGYNGYPQGYQQAYSQFGGADRGAFLNALSNLPRVLSGLLRDPGETLQGMMERADVYTGAVVAGLSLLFTFLAAMIVSRGAISAVFTGLSGLLNLSLANDAASMNQGVNYIAGKIAAPLGGIATLCQLFALVLPAAVTLVYLCVFRRVRFSFLLVSNLVALTTLPSVAASLLCMVFGLLSPYLALIAMFMGGVASYVIMSLLISRITGLAEQHSAGVRILLICLSEVLKILFMQFVGGALLSSAMHTVTALMSTMSSLL